MAETETEIDDLDRDDEEARGGSSTILKWLAIVVGGLVLLIALAAFVIDTGPGRRFVVGQLNGLELENGLDIDIGAIDGSLYGEMVVRDIALADPEGVFFTSPEVAVDWHPFAFVTTNTLDIDDLSVPAATLIRLPALNETPQEPDAPLLPEFDIDIDRFEIGRLDLGEAITGQRHALGGEGAVEITSGRAVVDADLRALSGDGLAGGDRLRLALDAVPDDDRLNVDLDIAAPADGLVASFTGITEPLTATLSGDGSWADWSGGLQAASGNETLASLDLSAANGRFTVRGPLRLSPIFEGAPARLTAPQLDVDLVADVANSIADIDLSLGSSALAATAEGRIDFGRTAFDAMRVEAQLLEPGSMADGVTGRAVRLVATMDGGTANFTADYGLRAEALGVGDIQMQDLAVDGEAAMTDGALTLPIQLSADRVSGLNDIVGGLLTNIGVNGTFLYADGRLATDDLTIDSDRIDGTLVLVADLTESEYTGGFQGEVNRFDIPGVGLANITAGIELVTAPDGGFGVRGPVRLRTTRIDSDIIREFIGGQATVTGQLVSPGDGAYGIDNLRVTGPGLRASGEGRYTADGRLQLAMSGASEVQGPFAVRVDGPADALVIRVKAQRPTLGLEFSDVDAVIRGTDAGYTVDATGGTPYGSASADLLIIPGKPLRVDVRRGEVAGVVARGQLRQLPAGPFAGDLALSGGGVDGTLNLSGEGELQAGRINAAVRNFQSTGTVDLAIARADLDMGFVLAEAGPRVEGDAQVRNLRYGAFRVARARAEIDSPDGETGTAKIFATGRAPTPYEVAINARLGTDSAVAAVRGEIARQAFRTVDPARVAIEDGEYRLAPVTLRLPQGDLRVAGTYGTGLTFQTRFDDFNLAILNAYAPAAGFSGQASGSVDWAQDTLESFPEADLRLTLDNFTRSGAVAISQPVDIELAARLDADGGNATGVMRERGRQVGRMKIALSPLSPRAGPWLERLLESPLDGGLRYNGPASALFSFAGLEGQSLNGALAVAADVDGLVDAPTFDGVVRANDLTYENEIYGTRIEAIELAANFTRDSLIVDRFQGQAGSGTVGATGSVNLSADDGYPIDIDVTLDRAELANLNDLSAEVSGNIAVDNGPNRAATITGELNIPEARYRIARSGDIEIVELDGVRRRPVPLRDPEDVIEGEEATGELPTEWQLDIDIVANNQIFVQGMGLDSEWEMALNVGGTSADYRVTGNVELIRGTFSFANTGFELDRGLVEFTGEGELNPRLDIVAIADVNGVTANINIGGRAFDPDISFSSTPARPEEEILSLILFGGPPSELGAIEAVQLAAALNGLRGSGGGFNPVNSLQSATGFDRLKIEGADEATGRGTALAVGEYLADDVYIEIVTDTRGFTATQIEIALTRALSLLSSVSNFGGQSANVRYSKDY
ncbi:MAG: translocation/assembly module TamB domain-containing protein [Pacificimonas sp.]